MKAYHAFVAVVPSKHRSDHFKKVSELLWLHLFSELPGCRPSIAFLPSATFLRRVWFALGCSVASGAYEWTVSQFVQARHSLDLRFQCCCCHCHCHAVLPLVAQVLLVHTCSIVCSIHWHMQPLASHCTSLRKLLVVGSVLGCYYLHTSAFLRLQQYNAAGECHAVSCI